MHITTKLMIGVALTAWLGIVAAEVANAQSYWRYAYAGYYGGSYGNSYDRAGSASFGGM
jgi:hypothetical protein